MIDSASRYELPAKQDNHTFMTDISFATDKLRAAQRRICDLQRRLAGVYNDRLAAMCDDADELIEVAAEAIDRASGTMVTKVLSDSFQSSHNMLVATLAGASIATRQTDPEGSVHMAKMAQSVMESQHE
jgi:hypothetical protein